MTKPIKQLIIAEEKALLLFKTIEERKFIVAGKTEKELNNDIYNLAYELFGIKKYWHKRIVRAGENTLLPYQENPINKTIKKNDILFLDFGPVFEDWEADIGRTFTIGDDEKNRKLKNDIEIAWQEGKEYFEKNKGTITGAEFYTFTSKLAQKFGWEYGNEHCGHLIGNFPHEKLQGEEITNYIHPNNHQLMSDHDKYGNQRYWIYEIHFIDKKEKIGGFFEQLLSS